MPAINFRILSALRTMRDAFGDESYDYCLGLIEGSEGIPPESPSERYLEGYCAGVIMAEESHA